MKTPWIMAQDWLDVLFLHWPAEPELLRPHLPEELELDIYDGQAWIGVVPFEARDTRLRLLPPVPGVRRYLELNVRTYVTCRERKGVYFFTLDANSRLAVGVAGGLLPYRHARMEIRRSGRGLRFRSKRRQADSFPETFSADFRIGPELTERTPLERWLTERYSLWTKPADHLLRVDIAHSPWQLRAASAAIRANSMGSFIRSSWRGGQPLVHYGGGKHVYFWPPVKERGGLQ
ncbi:YqjF family protein [Indiicoccus explosivorum]|uniref:YqjF family protein n=1 Tax=Indiicoccus explosivorum TaxID=1917864 RepID=UPI000B42F542|nr:DUF2071 domain-containing protein [Indiicoccus explosivorum]